MKSPRLPLIASFLAFANAENMTEAAAAIGLSQSAMTLHMQEFAEAFDLDVFVMEGRKKTLTSFGRELANTLAQKFNGIDNEISQVVQRFKSPSQITVRISGRPEIIGYIGCEISFVGNLVLKPPTGRLHKMIYSESEPILRFQTIARKMQTWFRKSSFQITSKLWRQRNGCGKRFIFHAKLLLHF